MPRERVRDTFVQRYDLAKHVGQGLTSRILSTAEGASGREGTLLNRLVSERSWSGRSSGDPATVLRSRSGGGVGRKSESGWEPARRRLPGDRERQRHEWRGQGRIQPKRCGVPVRGRRGATHRRGLSLLSPKLARGNTSATHRGPGRREPCCPPPGNPCRAGHAVGAFASASAGSVKQAATRGT